MLTNAQEHLVNNKVGDIFSYISIFSLQIFTLLWENIFFFKNKCMWPWLGSSVG